MKAKLALSCLATLLCLALPAAAEGPQGIYADVIRMLEADLSEEVILDWLEGDKRPVPKASADDLIGLKGAGASQALLEKLLGLSRREAAPLPTAPAEPTVPVPTEPSTPPAARAEPSSAAEAPAARPTPSRSPGDQALVTFRLAYIPPKVDFDHELWDLYVYLNGEPLAYVPPNTSFLDRGDAVEFRRSLEPGPHLLVVTQERHERQSKKRWRHEARVSPEVFAFEVLPNHDGEAELTYNEGLLGTNSGGPLTFRIVQSDQVTEMEGVGGSPDSWAQLCEEIEANIPEGKSPGRSAQDELARCVRWGELWHGIEGPTRDQIREALAAFDYRPVPRGS
jgi:hypothetical protein